MDGTGAVLDATQMRARTHQGGGDLGEERAAGDGVEPLHLLRVPDEGPAVVGEGVGQGGGEEEEVGDGDAAHDDGRQAEEAGLQEVVKRVGDQVVGGVEVLGELVEDAPAGAVFCGWGWGVVCV